MDNIDVVVEWIYTNNASYISMSDKVVWFASITGSRSNEKWQEVSLQQLRRIITASRQPVSEDDIIAAFQELGEVYDMAVNSTHTTPVNIFNYSRDADASAVVCIKDIICTLEYQGIRSIPLEQFTTLYNTEMKRRYSVGKLNAVRRNKLLRSVLPNSGWSILENEKRVKVNKHKLTVLRSDKDTRKVAVLSKDIIATVASALEVNYGR